MQYPSYDQLLQELVDTKTQEGEINWRRAALYHVAIDHYMVSARAVAAEAGDSESTARQYAKTWRTFPDEEDRFPDVSFTIYKICARTDGPRYWLRQAVENSWSTRELSKAINGETIQDDLREAKSAWSKVQRILNQGGPGAEYLLKQVIDFTREQVGAITDWPGEQKEKAPEGANA